jgi:aryl-phospho-beta-D-glucosidase BglC (GH1 family)
MKKLAVSLMIWLICFPFALFAQGFVKASGRDMVDGQGKKLLLKGVGLGFWLMPEGYPWELSGTLAPRQYYDLFADLIGPEKARQFWKTYQDSMITEADIRHIKKTGFNSVRIPFDYRLFQNEYFLGAYAPRGMELLERVVEWCRKHGLYAILDMHATPGSQAGWHSDDGYVYPWLFGDDNEVYVSQISAIWQSIAKRFAREPMVLGYDLMNEPIHQYCDTAVLNKRLEPVLKRIIAAIRAVDKNHMVIVEGAFWARNFDMFSAPLDPNMSFSTHLYSLTAEYTSFDYFVGISKKHNVPMWIGEFGELGTEFVDTLRTLAERNNFGWCLWPYKKMNNNRGIVQVKKPAHWKLISTYSEACFKGWEDKVKRWPDKDSVHAACRDFLENIRYANCTPSEFYLKALGLKNQ